MLARANINNTSTNVYTPPTGKKAYVYCDIWVLTPGSLTVKIGDIVYWEHSNVSGQISIKLVIDSSDVLNISTTGNVNVFVHGVEV